VTSIRGFGALTLALPLAIGVVAFGPDAAAQAAGTGIKSPRSNAVITSGSTTTVSAHLDLLATGDLYVRGPGTGDHKIGGGIGPKDISGRVNIGRNGAYVVTLKGLLGTIEQRTFYVREPPARPSGLDAGVSDHKLIVRWSRGDESDLTGYDVYVGGSRKRQGTPGALCAGEVCSTALSLPASGGRVNVGVRARRATGTGGTIASGFSTTSVTLPGLPTGALSGGGRSPNGLPSQSTNPLLPLPGKSPSLSLPTVAPDGQASGFQYPTPGPQVANPATGPETKKSASASPLRWGKSVALAMILLIVAAHIGAWTRRMRLAQAAEATTGAANSRTGRKKLRLPSGRRRGSGASNPMPGRPGEDSSVNTSRTHVVGATDERRPTRPASGRLIDAKGTSVDAALLGSNGDPRRSAAEPDDDLLDDSPASTNVVGATAGPRSTASDGRPRPQHSKVGRSHGRRSAGYRGRRRAD
jgi:hypothetical protein